MEITNFEKREQVQCHHVIHADRISIVMSNRHASCSTKSQSRSVFATQKIHILPTDSVQSTSNPMNTIQVIWNFQLTTIGMAKNIRLCGVSGARLTFETCGYAGNLDSTLAEPDF